MKKKSLPSRGAVIILAVLLILGTLGGCGGTTPPAATPTSTATSAAESPKDTTSPAVAETTAAATAEATQAADPKLDKTEYYEIELFQESLDPKVEEMAGSNSFRKMLKDKFNFGYKLIAYPGDAMEKVTLMVSAADYPDMVRLYKTKYIKAYVEAGALVELGPLMDEYGPNFKKRHEFQIPIWQKTSGVDDGKIWIYSYNGPDMSYGISRPFLEWVVRSDILEQQGYPNIANEFDLMDVLKKGLQANPKTDGKPTVGIAFPLAAWGTTGQEVITYQYNLGRLHHLTNNNKFMSYDIAQKKFIDLPKEYSFKEGLRFFNLAYREGVLDKESITDDYDIYAKKMEEGRALSNWFMNWGYTDFNSKIQQAGKNYRYIPMPIILKSQAEKGEKKTQYVSGDEAWGSMGITKNAKYPERLMEVMDYLATEEGMVRTGWGEEGKQYTVKDGKRVATKEFVDKIKAADPDYGYTWGAATEFGFFNGIDPNGQMYSMMLDPDVVALTMDDQVKAVYAKYGWQTYKDAYEKNKNFKIEFNLPGDFKMSDPNFSDDQRKQIEKINATTSEYVVKLITAKSDDAYNKLYDEMLAKRDTYGLQAMVDQWNKEYADLVVKYKLK